MERVEFIATSGKKGTAEYQEFPGSVMLYTEEELAALEEAGLHEGHDVLLNQIVKIRAMDAARLAAQEKSIAGRAKAKAKADPAFEAALEALLEQYK